jgi:hypothetical protein
MNRETFYSGAGGEVDECAVTLRFFGEDIDPNAITAALGIAPTQAARRGKQYRGRFEAQKGLWLLSHDRSAETADHQIQRLFASLSSDLRVWSLLSSQYYAEIKCDLFLEQWCRATILCRETIAAIACRGLQLQVDIYTPHDLYWS